MLPLIDQDVTSHRWGTIMSREASPSVEKAASEAVVDRHLAPLPRHWRSLSHAFVHQARSRPTHRAMADSTGATHDYREVFLRAVALGRVLARLTKGSTYVGVMIPPTAMAAISNIALTLRGQIPVNLNYTAGQASVDASIAQCKMTHVVTSRKVTAKFHIKPNASLIYLEDLARQVTPRDKAFAWTVSRLVPTALLSSFLPGLRGDRFSETATVIFTSGSTGEPKGVMLSHRNVLTNIHQYAQQVDLGHDEVILGILPFFHSFGFNVPLWAVLCLGFTGVYHFSPLDARIVGNLCDEHKATILLATPTFFQGYAKRCDRGQFATMRLAIVGAEKLRPEVAEQIEKSLGLRLLEGYGCTELSPIVSVNALAMQRLADGRVVSGLRPGTVGLPVPGTEIKTIDPESGADREPGAEGIVCVRGPQVMLGYLDKPEATAKVLRDGWYVTGDLGHLDADGFLSITGRLSRFSKIAGEMVPHEGVERALIEAGNLAARDEPALAVTAVPDPKRQERLIVVHTALEMPAAELCQKLAEKGLPKLWIPSADDFYQVEAIPLLGSGKLDLRRLKELAETNIAGNHAVK